jgi:hypothetical protein
MFLVHFFNQQDYEFHMSLHTTREAAEAAVNDLLRHFDVKQSMSDNPNPTRDDLFDENGEGVHMYVVTCDGDSAEQISIDRTAEAATA